MKNGFRIVDTDTHVVPAMEILHDHAGEELRRRWEELDPHLDLVTKLRTDIGDLDEPYHRLLVSPQPLDRRVGAKLAEPKPTAGGAQEKKISMAAHVVKTIEDGPEIGVWHDNAEGRLRAMDREGADRHVIIPGTFAMASTAIDPWLSRELMAAYNRYIVEYCAVDPDRLKAVLQVHGADAEWSAREIKEHAADRSVGAVTINLPQDLPIDDPDLHPIWRAMEEADLGILHHSFFFEPPYFPGYRDIWGNVVVGRAAAHPWGAQRLVAYLVLAGLFDAYPRLRIGFAEVGAGWLPFWLYRLRGQAEYMRGAVPDMKRDPIEYAQAGHIYVGLEFYESESIARSIIDVLGEDCLMWQSDFPHLQCNFPNSPDEALSWTNITDAEKRKIMAENAERFLRMS